VAGLASYMNKFDSLLMKLGLLLILATMAQ